ncbi:hypothetical protein K8I61_13395 [bacterium]|nr:hypothetical protein [bacterium]
MAALYRTMRPRAFRAFMREMGDLDPREEIAAVKAKLLEVAGTDDVDALHAELDRKYGERHGVAGAMHETARRALPTR